MYIVSNVIFWSGNNFIFAHRIHLQLQKFFPKNPQLILKNGDYYYRLWEYQKALKAYSSVACDDETFLCQTLWHNTWNTLYRLWEKTDDIFAKIYFWQEALQAYSASLKSGFESDTKANYDFVALKLRWLTLPNQPDQKDEEKQEDTSQEKEEQTDEEKKETQEDASSQDNPWDTHQDMIWEKTPSMKIDGTTSWDALTLPPEKLQEIEKYIENLEEQEKQNIPLNNQPKQKDIFDIFNDGFFNGFDPNDHKW